MGSGPPPGGARQGDIRQETLDRAFDGLEPVPQVLERDRQQAEFALDLTSLT